MSVPKNPDNLDINQLGKLIDSLDISQLSQLIGDLEKKILPDQNKPEAMGRSAPAPSAKEQYFITEISSKADKQLASLAVRGADTIMLTAYINLIAPFGLKAFVTDRFVSDIHENLCLKMPDKLIDEGLDHSTDECREILHLFAKMLRYEAPETWDEELGGFGFDGLSDPAAREIYNWLYDVRISELCGIKVTEDPEAEYYIRLRNDYTESKYGSRKALMASLSMIDIVCCEPSNAFEILARLDDTLDDNYNEPMAHAVESTLADKCRPYFSSPASYNLILRMTAYIYGGDAESAENLLSTFGYSSLFDPALHSDLSVVVIYFGSTFGDIYNGNISFDSPAEIKAEEPAPKAPEKKPSDSSGSYRAPELSELQELEREMGMPENMLALMFSRPDGNNRSLLKLIAIHRLEKGDASGLTDDMVRTLMASGGINASDTELRSFRRKAQDDPVFAKMLCVLLANM